jgi:hypothetical protein
MISSSSSNRSSEGRMGHARAVIALRTAPAYVGRAESVGYNEGDSAAVRREIRTN